MTVAGVLGTQPSRTVLGNHPIATGDGRQVSQGAVWAVGGLAPVPGTTDDGHGHLVRSGTTARVFSTSFSISKPNVEEDLEKYQGRVASALDIDRVRKVLDFDGHATFPRCADKRLTAQCPSRTTWIGTAWTDPIEPHKYTKNGTKRVLPAAPFRVLDAPNLRDDFYCSVLAYSPSSRTLAVGLGNVLYAWSEGTGVKVMHGLPLEGVWLTSLAFSSTEGDKSILAIGRSNGSLVLKSTVDTLPRFEIGQPHPIACVSWRPVSTSRPSKSPFNPGVTVMTEDLLVGDETGIIYYYLVEWPLGWEVTRNTWSGSISLKAKISLHTQQICGLAWSPDGKLFASGGNDNLCCLTEVDKVLADPSPAVLEPASSGSEAEDQDSGPDFETTRLSAPHAPQSRETSHPGAFGDTAPPTPSSSIRHLESGSERYRWVHGAAIKAIAFCPWREGLVATGGGSNDKCIHFYHTMSGAALATIAVSAQVTSLIWSTTRREIAATFGYAQPDHPFRIAIFSWPDCKQVAAIPWEGDLRALYAIPYPSSPLSSTSEEFSRPAQEGCIVVASSDKSVKFHEVWSSERQATVGGAGTLGGSDILEALEGIDKEGDVIR